MLVLHFNYCMCVCLLIEIIDGVNQVLLFKVSQSCFCHVTCGGVLVLNKAY